MATFTRIIQERVGAVSAVNTYSMRGDFKPAEAFAALEAIDRVKEEVVQTLKVDIGHAFENLKLWEGAMDERVHVNCRSTVGYGLDNAPPSKFEGLGIAAMRQLLKRAVERDAPMAERREIQRRIHALLRARARKQTRRMAKVRVRTKTSRK